MPSRLLRVVVAVGVLSGILTAHRLAVYQDEVRLWWDAAQQSASPRPWINIGSLQYRAHDRHAAEWAYTVAIEKALARAGTPQGMIGEALAKANLGTLYVEMGGDRVHDGTYLIAQAHDRWPENPDITQRLIAVRR